MADAKITELTAMLGADMASTDVIPIVDVSAPAATKKATRTEFFKNVPQLQVQANYPSVQLVESDGSASFNKSAFARNVDYVSFLTMLDDTILATDYRYLTSVNGAIQHEWRIGNAEKMRLTATGLGILNTNPLKPLDVSGDALIRGNVYKEQGTITTKSADASLTAAEVMAGIIRNTGAAVSLTMPTGTALDTFFNGSLSTNGSFDFVVINSGSGTATMVTNTGLTLIGAMGVTSSSSGSFRLRRTAADTYTLYRIG